MKRLGCAWRWNRLWLATAVVVSVSAGLPVAVAARRNATPSAQPTSTQPAPTYPASTQPPDRRVSAERTGAVPVAGTHHLSLTADSGSVRVFTDATSEVRYRVHVEAEAADPDASQLLKQFSLTARRTSRGVELTGRMPSRDAVERVWVTYEVHVPRTFDLEISTQAGDIETQDIDGRVVLSTGGGTIRAGRIGAAARGDAPQNAGDSFAARLETGGGHIFVGDVAGALRASTAGGHIVAGNVAGDAVLHTDGGHIQVGRVSGLAQLSTGGGNIVAQGADKGVQADSAGGRIELGEAGGAIHARTGGGGIRIARLSGPTDLDSSEGGIFLAGIAAPLHAATAAGSITAWFSPTFGSASAGSELTSRQGNIIVYLPKEMALTIDALVEQGTSHRIVADPSMPRKVRYEESPTGRAERGEFALNGGGRMLHLTTMAGDIELRVLDPETARQLAKQQVDAVAQGLDAQRAILSAVQGSMPEASGDGVRPSVSATSSETAVAPSGGFSGWTRWFDEFWWGGLRVAPEEQQKRLVRSAPPAYPDVAQQAGIEGDVTLRVVVAPDGTVNDVRLVAGDPVLARAAADAVEQWHYAPALLDGRPVSVVTTVTLAFRLR